MKVDVTGFALTTSPRVWS